MPSFYPHRPLPLTPPEYSTGYQSNNCASMQYPPHVYAAPQATGRPDEMSYEYSGRYGQPQTAGAAAGHQQAGFSAVSMPPINRYSEPIGLPLPSVRSFDQSMLSAQEAQYARSQEYRPHSHYEQQQQQQQQQQQHQQAKVKEEKPVGGVSAKLDYDMDWMTDFVSDMAQKIVQPGKAGHHNFRGWVHSVLCATRLPSATIILSLHYLSIRMTQLSNGRQLPQDNQIYRLLTVALILGSKFLDDNTFINRSWADVSMIDIKILNQMEMDWLAAIEYRLHRDPSEAQGFQSWLACWKAYESEKLANTARSLKLSPIDTNVSRQSSVHKTFTPQSSQSAFPPPSVYDGRPLQPGHYHTPAYTRYDPWLIPRTNETSPVSAPHTGPTTPEYYGGPGTWAPIENGAYSYNRAFGYGPMPQPQGQVHVQPQSATYTPFTPQYHHHAWSGHGVHCSCGHCSRQHPPFFMASGFGPQIVAA